MTTFIDTVITGLMVGSIYSLLALGFVLVFKATAVVNLAHGGVLVLGAYLAYELAVASGLPVWLGIILTLLVGMLIGLFLDWAVMRRMIGQPLIAAFVVTLVLFALIDALIIMIWGARDFYFPFAPTGTVTIFGFSFVQAHLYSSGAALFLFTVLVLLFRYTNIGLAMRCVSEDVQVSQSLGISVKTVFAITWMVACLVAVLSGILYGMAYSVNPSISVFGLSKGLPVILLGGMRSIPGALVGGLALGLLEMLVGQYAEPAVNYELRTPVVMAMILIMLLFRPTGIFGERHIERI